MGQVYQLTAERLTVEKDLISRTSQVSILCSSTVRLMRMATPEFFAELGEHVYGHTPYSLVYLNPAIGSMFKFMYASPARHV